ncbi:hypothetical protein [Melioribacter sp. OK-6-Me]|uniref:hypothetical protein n=1 Tax=unclassified Melioribacter TaxID=2627329 RepID=UPI003EDACAA4
MKSISYNKLLSVFLWLVALHSLLVGIGLIIMPGSLVEFMGYTSCNERFFRAQGGVFHIAIAVGYALSAYNPKRFECLIIFSIIVKFIATVFLLSYWIFVTSLALIIISGVSDFLMGIIILFLFDKTKNREEMSDE